jgi:hypothetical protein
MEMIENDKYSATIDVGAAWDGKGDMAQSGSAYGSRHLEY